MTRHVRQPWERLPDEGEAPYEAFRKYLMMDPPRRLADVAKAIGRARSTLELYSKRYRWAVRARAYDDAMRLKHDKSAMRTAERLGEEHMEAAKFLRDLGLSELNRRARRIRAKAEARDAEGKPADDLEPVMRDRDALRMAIEGIRIERLVTGQATERIAQEEPWDLSKLTDEEVALLRSIRDKATS